MNLNLYDHLKLATELSEAANTNHATHLEHRSLDSILELCALVRSLQGELDETKSKTVNNVRYFGNFPSPSLGYGATGSK